MGAYNKVYGEQASESKLLLKDILRDMWALKDLPYLTSYGQFMTVLRLLKMV